MPSSPTWSSSTPLSPRTCDGRWATRHRQGSFKSSRTPRAATPRSRAEGPSPRRSALRSRRSGFGSSCDPPRSRWATQGTFPASRRCRQPWSACGSSGTLRGGTPPARAPKPPWSSSTCSCLVWTAPRC
jgi:hypothetical protein